MRNAHCLNYFERAFRLKVSKNTYSPCVISRVCVRAICEAAVEQVLAIASRISCFRPPPCPRSPDPVCKGRKEEGDSSSRPLVLSSSLLLLLPSSSRHLVCRRFYPRWFIGDSTWSFLDRPADRPVLSCVASVRPICQKIFQINLVDITDAFYEMLSARRRIPQWDIFFTGLKTNNPYACCAT